MSVSTSIVVPWRPDGGQRDRLWAWCRRWWESELPGAEIVECDSGDELFTRGRSLNIGAQKATGDLLILADADTVVSDVHAAIDLVDNGWVIAYEANRYYRLTEEETERWLKWAPGFIEEPPRPDDLRMYRNEYGPLTSWSGVLVMRRSSFATAGGFDPRFVGWGHEDFGFMEAMNTLVSPVWRSPGFAVQLWHFHDETQRFGQPNEPANRELVNRYGAASGNREAMLALVAER